MIFYFFISIFIYFKIYIFLALYVYKNIRSYLPAASPYFTNEIENIRIKLIKILIAEYVILLLPFSFNKNLNASNAIVTADPTCIGI